MKYNALRIREIYDHFLSKYISSITTNTHLHQHQPPFLYIALRSNYNLCRLTGSDYMTSTTTVDTEARSVNMDPNHVIFNRF
ncbi:hypothetical protein Hanom_Chr14g01250711 [Helianthus anomalus]